MAQKVVQNVAILAGLFLFILGISCLINNSNFLKENYDSPVVSNEDDENNTLQNQMEETEPREDDNEDANANQEDYVNSSTESVPGCLPKDQLTPMELLPKEDEANQWSQANPSGTGTLGDKSFLQAGHHVGINTVGQTLRNANMQLRSDPPNPQVQVSPWIQSTISPDTNRKPFEIGGSA